MENAVDALKIAFAVMVFAIALSVTFSVISHAKSTADSVLFFNDKTNFREEKTAIEDENGGKIVELAEVISTINRCKTEKISVTVKEAETEYNFDKDNTTKYKNVSDITKEIYRFISTHNTNDKYREYFSEVTYTGEYAVGEDGTKLVVKPGDSKIYITYIHIR